MELLRYRCAPRPSAHFAFATPRQNVAYAGNVHACSVKGICKSILFKHTKITVYLQKQMLFL